MFLTWSLLLIFFNYIFSVRKHSHWHCPATSDCHRSWFWSVWYSDIQVKIDYQSIWPKCKDNPGYTCNCTNYRCHFIPSSFSPSTQEQFGHVFAIHNTTGEVRVVGEVDFEHESMYQLFVYANDLGPSSVPAEAVVIIHVQVYLSNVGCLVSTQL